jgi:tRNA-dependent cyclodipeptide synthase
VPKAYDLIVKGNALLESDQICTLGISVGEHFHEGAKLTATLKWAEGRFQRFHVFLCDTIHRFNYPCYFKGDQELAANLARQAGDEWLNRNISAFEGIKLPYEISRWDDWVKLPGFVARYGQMQSLFENNEALRAALTKDASRYLDNNWEKLKDEGITYQERVHGGIAYMLEELSVLAIIAETVSPLEIYAGPDSQAAQACKTDVVADAPLGLEMRRSVRIDFKYKK